MVWSAVGRLLGLPDQCLCRRFCGVELRRIPGGSDFRSAGTPVCFINCVNLWTANLYSFHPGCCGINLCDGSRR